jgi:hypothetical protein
VADDNETCEHELGEPEQSGDFVVRRCAKCGWAIADGGPPTYAGGGTADNPTVFKHRELGRG